MAPFPFLKNIVTEKTYLLYFLLSLMQLLSKFRHYSINFMFLQVSLLECSDLLKFRLVHLCAERKAFTLRPSFNLNLMIPFIHISLSSWISHFQYPKSSSSLFYSSIWWGKPSSSFLMKCLQSKFFETLLKVYFQTLLKLYFR